MRILRLALAGVVVLQSAGMSSASNRDDCLQDQDRALAARACPLYQAEIAASKQLASQTPTAETPAAAPVNSLFDRDWLLDPAASRLSITTVKQKAITETHSFKTLDGSISAAGEAKVTIILDSLDTNVDIRNVRMRFLFFETFKYPQATLTAQLDQDRFKEMSVGETVAFPLDLRLDLHGVVRDLTVDIVAVRVSEYAVRIVSAKPFTVSAADFSLSDGVQRLSEAAGGIEIEPSATVTFELAFEGGQSNPDLLANRLASAQGQLQERTRVLTPEECQNRMDVISDTRQIYFASGSARLDGIESAPVLDEVAQFFNRCPMVTMQIAGHTDTDGGESYNMDLSNRRAIAVAEALISRDVEASRISTVGYGYSQPVADNATSAGKAKNRRIEFNRSGG